MVKTAKNIERPVVSLEYIDLRRMWNTALLSNDDGGLQQDHGFTINICEHLMAKRLKVITKISPPLSLGCEKQRPATTGNEL